MRNWIITYDKDEAEFGENQLLAFIRDNRLIEQWVRPYPGTYLFKSDAALTEINRSFRRFFSGGGFFIGGLDPVQCGGILLSETWDWLNTGALPEDMVQKLKATRITYGTDAQRLLDEGE